MKMTTHYPNKYEKQAKKWIAALTLIKRTSCPENVIELVALCLTLFPKAWCSSEGCQVAFQYVKNVYSGSVFLVLHAFLLLLSLFGKTEIVRAEYLIVFHT